MFEHGLSVSGNGPFLGWRAVYSIGCPVEVLKEYKWMSFAEAADIRTLIGSGLMGLLEGGSGGEDATNISVKLSGKIGLFSVNRPEWVITDAAIQSYSLITVALYDTFGPNALEFILNHAEISVTFCSGDRIPNLLKIAHKCPKLKYIISFEELGGDESAISGVLRGWASNCGIRIVSWGELMKLGRDNLVPHRPPKVDDVCAICYTSGTTGNPKGAVYIHRMCACSIKNFAESGIILDGDVVHLSYLPLAHCYEKTFMGLMCYYGARIGFTSGDVLRLAEDAQTLKPTIFLGVPRVYNKMYDAIRANTIDAPGLKGVLARAGYAAKLQNLINAKTYKHAVWDKLLFSKVAAVLGGRVRYIITGSAPVDFKVMQFFRIMFSCEFCEGYGSTESCAYGSVLPVDDFSSGNVGQAPTCCEVKLVGVPEMNYHVTDPIPKGELCYRGPFIFKGYYRDEEKTAEAVDSSGWLHTGDIASFNPATSKISIIDRKKNIFKLSQGEYVAPENLEIVYINCPWIAQIFVHGDSLKNDLVAIIVPKEDMIASWFKQHGRHENSASLNDELDLKALIAADLLKVAREHRLNGFEYIRAFFLERDQFTLENDLLTPTFKLKRHQARIRYAKQIAALYEEIEANESKPVVMKSRI
jgi:long-chain acyl-CoA synthetase